MERTAEDVARYLERYWRDKRTAAEVFAAYHIRMGGRAPGESCATCDHHHHTRCYLCRETNTASHYRPKGGRG